MEGNHAPDQQMVLAIAVSPAFATDGTGFAARATGLERTRDRGATWQPAYASLDDAPPTVAVAVSPAFATDRLVIAGVPGGILGSDDGGETWRAVSLGAPPPLVSALAFSPHFADDGTILAGTAEDRMFRSTDRGLTWSPANVGLIDMAILVIAPAPPIAPQTTVFIGTGSGLYRSHNGGRSWHDLGLPAAFAPVLSLALSPRFATDRTVFAGTEFAGLLRSRDSGSTWERLGEHQLGSEISAILTGEATSGESEMIVVHDGRIALSRGDGAIWSDHRGDEFAGEYVTAIAATDHSSPASSIIAGLANGMVLTLENSTQPG